MPSWVHRPAFHLLILVSLAVVLFFIGLGKLPLLEPDEGRNAEVAREMLVSGNWLTPHFNSFAYLDKPVVYFWMVAASFKTFGVTEGAARLPSALMGLLTVLAVWFVAKKMFGGSGALRAGIVFATSPLVLAFSRIVIFDMTLTFLVTLAMICFWLAESGGFRNPWLDVGMFASMGVATITKGPVGFLLPLLSIVVYEALRGRTGELKRLRWGLGVAVFLVAVLPWFIAVSVRNPDFPSYALWNESLKRFATGGAHRRGGLFYYIPVYLGGFLPWSLCLLLAGWNRLKRWRQLRQDGNRATLFLLSWVALILVFFTISQSKLPGYFLPAIVPLSILMARAWADLDAEGRRRAPDWVTAGFAILLGVGLLVALSSSSWVFSLVHARLAKKLDPSVIGYIKPTLLYTGLILGALAIIGRNVAARARSRFLSSVAFVILALTVPLIVARCLVPLRIYFETDSSRRLARTILSSQERDLPIYGYYYFRTSLPFYLRRPVGLVSTHWGQMTSNYQVAHQAEVRRELAEGSGASALGQAGEASSPGRGLLLSPAQFESLTQTTPRPLLMLIRNSDVVELARSVGQLEPLWNEWEYSVWEIPRANPSEREGKPPRVVGPFTPR